MTMDSDPIVAVGRTAPTTGATGSHRVTPGPVVLSIWGKARSSWAICADIVDGLPDRACRTVQKAWEAASGARDAAVAGLRAPRRIETKGFEAETWPARSCASAARSAHLPPGIVGTEVHGNGANLDHFETRDERLLVPYTGFSIEPGVYLEGRFGVRREIDMYWRRLPRSTAIQTTCRRSWREPDGRFSVSRAGFELQCPACRSAACARRCRTPGTHLCAHGARRFGG
jgi:hypothetical protein